MFKFFIKNFVTTIIGAFAGLPQVVHGVGSGSLPEIITGASVFLLGLFAKDAHNPE